MHWQLPVLNRKNISKKDFKKFHPSGNLGAQLRTVEDLMVKGNKIPFVNESFKYEKKPCTSFQVKNLVL